jgi:hypothetical protein
MLRRLLHSHKQTHKQPKSHTSPNTHATPDLLKNLSKEAFLRIRKQRRARRALRREIAAVVRAIQRGSIDTVACHTRPLRSARRSHPSVEAEPATRTTSEEEQTGRRESSDHHLDLMELEGRSRRWRLVGHRRRGRPANAFQDVDSVWCACMGNNQGMGSSTEQAHTEGR